MGMPSTTLPTPVLAHPSGVANTLATLTASQIRFGFRTSRATVAAEWLRLDAMCIATVSGVPAAMMGDEFEDLAHIHATCIA